MFLKFMLLISVFRSDNKKKYEMICAAAEKGERELIDVIKSGVPVAITNEVNKC
jgi:uncharacterized membrane protein